MKNFTLFKIISGAIIVFIPTASALAQDPSWLVSISDAGYGLVGQLVPLLISIALLVFIWGIVIFIAKSGDEKALAEGKQKMIWGIVALFVIVSVWGLVALLQQLSGMRSVSGIAPPSTTTSDGLDAPDGGGTPFPPGDDDDGGTLPLPGDDDDGNILPPPPVPVPLPLP